MKAFDAYNLGYRSGLIGDNMPAEADDASLVELDRMQAGWLTGRGEYLETSNNHLGGLVSYLLRNYPDDHWDESTKEMIEDADAHLGGGADRVDGGWTGGALMNTVPFNINDQVKVRVTAVGHRALKSDHFKLFRECGHTRAMEIYVPPMEDADGWSTWTLWDLMQRLGPHMCIGNPSPIETTIQLLVDEE